MPALYDQIGEGYDGTRRADPSITRLLLGHLQPQPAGIFLDVGCGTGNYAAALADAGLRVHGIDLSHRMLTAAKAKTSAVTWHQGDAGALPFADGTFSGIVCVLAVHHLADLGGACREAFRVLRQGRFVIFTAAHRQMRGCWLSAYFPGMVERAVAQMPDDARLIEALRAAGFHDVRTDPYEVTADLTDLFFYAGKHRPQLYLDPLVQAGMSAFACLAEPEEVQAGCARLAADLESGRWAEVAASYRHSHGDYLFVIAENI